MTQGYYKKRKLAIGGSMPQPEVDDLMSAGTGQGTDAGSYIGAGAGLLSSAINVFDKTPAGRTSVIGGVGKGLASGAAAGSTLGPLGAAIGGVAGAALGFFGAKKAQKAERTAKMLADRERTQQNQERYSAMARSNPNMVYGSKNVSYFEDGGNLRKDRATLAAIDARNRQKAAPKGFVPLYADPTKAVGWRLKQQGDQRIPISEQEYQTGWSNPATRSQYMTQVLPREQAGTMNVPQNLQMSPELLGKQRWFGAEEFGRPLAKGYLESGGGLSRSEDYGSKKKPYPSVDSSDFAGGGRSDVRAKVYAKYPELKKDKKMSGGSLVDKYRDGGSMRPGKY